MTARICSGEKVVVVEVTGTWDDDEYDVVKELVKYCRKSLPSHFIQNLTFGISADTEGFYYIAHLSE